MEEKRKVLRGAYEVKVELDVPVQKRQPIANTIVGGAYFAMSGRPSSLIEKSG